MTHRGKVKGRILYSVFCGLGYGVAKIEVWTVTSIQRKPRRGRYGHYLKPQPVTVYLKTGEGKKSLGDRVSFPLSDWPGDFSASPRTAWKAAVTELSGEIIEWEGFLGEAIEANYDAWEKEIRQDLKLLRRSLTKARRESI